MPPWQIHEQKVRRAKTENDVEVRGDVAAGRRQGRDRSSPSASEAYHRLRGGNNAPPRQVTPTGLFTSKRLITAENN